MSLACLAAFRTGCRGASPGPARAFVLFLVCGLAVTGVACRRSPPEKRPRADAGSSPARPAPEKPTVPAGFPVPRTTGEPNLVVTLDLRALRASPLGLALRSAAPVRQVLEKTGLAAVTARCRLDLWAEVDTLTLVMAFWPGERSAGDGLGQATLWARGRFVAPELLSCLARVVAGPGAASPRPAPAPGPVVIPVGQGSAQVTAEGQDGLRLTLGTRTAADRAAGVRDRATRSAVARSLPRSGLGTLVWVALPELIRRSLGQTPALGSIDLASAGVSVDLADGGLRLVVSLGVASPDQAAAAARTFVGAREAILRSDAALPPSTAALLPVLRRLTVAAEAAVVTLRVTLTLDEANALFLAPFRRYLDTARQAAGRAAPLPPR